MKEDLLELLRSDLQQADFRVDTVRELLGSVADEARLRGVFAPARRMLTKRGSTALGALVQLFLLGDTLSKIELHLALPTLQEAGAIQLGLVSSNDSVFRAALSLNPVSLPGIFTPTEASKSDWWFLSDLDDQLRIGPARPDHVMGVGGATRSLLSQLPFGDVALESSSYRALDLGTGCGVIALCLARATTASIVATDISSRALDLARANAYLNGLSNRIDFRQGNLFEPVTGEHFDLVASNPPFVISPRATDTESSRYEYRDAGFVGDALAERVVHEAPGHLKPGGSLICLANWESVWGSDGLSRVKAWIAQSEAGSDSLLGAWVVEREQLDPARYAETWVRDGGTRPGTAEFDQLMGAWLEDFEGRRVTAIGLGSIRMTLLPGPIPTSSFESRVRTERAGDPVSPEQPGRAFAKIFADALRVTDFTDAEVLATHWIRSDSVDEVREHSPGVDSPRALWLRTARPMSRTVHSDSLLTAAVGACDGDLSLGQISEALATILEVNAEACEEALVTGVRELVWLGMLEPPKR